MPRPALWHLILLAALLWSGEYLRRDLWEPDEVRYAYVAREMAQDGHWFVPYRSGEYYAHKPPYLFWAINAAARATGLPIGRIPVRLPGFFAGILVLWATARLAERWAGAKAASMLPTGTISSTSATQILAAVAIGWLKLRAVLRKIRLPASSAL